MKLCKDCGIKIHEFASHTGNEKWCEDCFDKGLCRDMHDHFANFIAEEMSPKDSQPEDGV